MANTLKLLSGNEALALGAYHAGVRVATAYPGTPSTEILESISRFEDVYAEWSTNEKVALEVGLGASYAGVRTLVSMKQVGLNVASDPFMAAAITGICGGLVVVSAGDPGIHSSQGEQDNRYLAKFAKVPLLDPADSQEAYEFMAYAFDISEKFDTPVMMHSTTRVSHSKSVVNVNRTRTAQSGKPAFKHDIPKYIMLPVHAKMRRPIVEDRLVKLAEFSETFPFNKIIRGDRKLGIVSSSIGYHYTREVFPGASFLKLGMPYPLPQKLIHEFAAQVEKLIVIEELEPFLQEHIQAMGIKVSGKEFIPRTGELDPDIVAKASARAGWLREYSPVPVPEAIAKLPKRPPLLCAGCPHTGMFFTLSTMGQRKLLDTAGRSNKELKLIITGDIGCYTLGALPPLRALDTTACMGAGIGQALGMEKAGVGSKVVAVIGDSTFLHSGITGLVNAVYDKGKITVIILDNRTTAMTGHQEHPGTGVSAQGKETQAVELESLARGIGVKNVRTVNAFDIKELRTSLKSALDSNELSVIIVRGTCAVRVKQRANPRTVDVEKCDQCRTCLMLGCPAIQTDNGQVFIDAALCAGDACTLCEQLCPHKAISAETVTKEAK